MAKFRKFNRKDLTPIQIRERKRRHMMSDRMLFGMPTPQGTPPRHFSSGGTTSEAPWKPMPRPGFPSFGLLLDLIALLPWFGTRRRKREAELAEKRRAESIKSKERRR
jgi:hypothetical protein